LTAEQTWPNPIVTQITSAETFWPAEDYHQRYYDQNPNQPYCMYVVGPKLHKLQERYGTKLKQNN
jgi:peptide-methionine (S)-S-oxide reductase